MYKACAQSLNNLKGQRDRCLYALRTEGLNPSCTLKSMFKNGLGNGSLKSEELNEGGICKDQLQIGDMWQDIQGANNWKSLLDPIHLLLKAEILGYGDFAQHCYDSFDNTRSSQYYGNCKLSKSSLGRRLESLKCGRGYQVTEYKYANTGLSLKSYFREKWRDSGAWMGYIAVCTDPNEIKRLGRRDIFVAWRDEGSGRSRLSAREIVVAEIKRLLNNFKDEDVSITFTGHSLGAALATISAYDIKQMLMNEYYIRSIPVTVFAFPSPRVGNLSFAQHVEEIGVKVLRQVNKKDLVPKVLEFS
ncbi:phospholipase A1-Igamma3, chloroplastic-like [Cryptomeria japonica]|uniref:phospholipase A1-Igamma3, chloroplastic-like n=1 Tax=Cryptomeria japonica TaxID=3369 RepID=UPI0027DAA5E9|nr:phospholipase A1-Igamma3, chloroplastic-like [Cryptomeria japonica]